MGNPWEDIGLDDYEKHMSLDSVKQLQTMNFMMKAQFDAYPVVSAMVLGIAGGNGLDHVDPEKYQCVYGVDINEDYLHAVESRYADLSDVLKCLKVDLINESDLLPHAELIIANLLIEYIGYEAFQKAVKTVDPLYVSCVIQINTDSEQWVSDSPYLHLRSAPELPALPLSGRTAIPHYSTPAGKRQPRIRPEANGVLQKAFPLPFLPTTWKERSVY